jgi:hypothetical protein
MYILVKCDQSINAGDVISYDETLQKWTLANDKTKMICVARTSAREYILLDETTIHVVEAVTSGVCYARATASILDQGGRLGVENGGVFVIDQTDSHCFILPNDIQAAPRSIGDLVRVNIR